MKTAFILGLCAVVMAACATAPAPNSPAPTAAAPVPVAPAPAVLKSIKLVIVGDSTVCIWPANDSLHREGWGMEMQPFFKSELQVVNLALSGRSTKTFISEGHWDKALAEKPDLVLIQFGHNDSHAPTNPEATDAATSFRDYLRKYIDDTRAIGAVPVLVTPMCRRTATDNLQPYADAMKIVGAEKHVPVIDLHASSAKLYAQLGPDVQSLEANVAGGGYDTTHFNAAGAKAMAKLVMDEFPAAAPQIKPYLK
ncbi:MAG TPA: rhamnogalacturonan acetylesterase [Opitutales bacterium]|jgi:lysophospholipase L1-like esterase|nr:rhamnogalacturonan acetylesterase [Opitutales bacterium]